MRKGGVTAANCTSCVWENFTDTMRNFARWKTWLRDNVDLISQVYTTDDIQRAKRESKTGIILGWQNSSGIEDRLDHLALFHVGAKTSEDAIKASKQRVAYSHCLPAGLKAHPRNKSDAQLRFIADKNGFIGVTMFPAFLK